MSRAKIPNMRSFQNGLIPLSRASTRRRYSSILGITTLMKKRISFGMRCKRDTIKQECNEKLLLKRGKSNNPNKNIYITKSNKIWQTAKIEIILPIGKETMMSIAMASSSSPCQSFPEALIPKTISLGH